MALVAQRKAWNKGMKGLQSWHNIDGLGKNVDFKKRGKSISRAKKGMTFTEEHKKNLSIAHMGIQAGEKCHLWKGGITPENHKIRNSTEYKQWRTAVFERDDYTCQDCEERGGVLNADHIQPFAYFPDLRFVIENGRTLCRSCHVKTDTWGKRVAQYEGRRVSLSLS